MIRDFPFYPFYFRSIITFGLTHWVGSVDAQAASGLRFTGACLHGLGWLVGEDARSWGRDSS